MNGGQRVGGYRLLRVIGEGGMGVVHLGLDAHDRAVAVKVMRPHVAVDPESRARLAREVRSLAKVRHPRVAEVLDADFDADLPYVVMRFVPGEALDAVVRRDGPLSTDLLDELAVGLFEALSAVHAVGVVHRDLKPGNVLLLDGSPVLIDFGIARAMDDAALTSTGLMVGTPGYLSPEVLEGTDVHTSADWWGWGAVLAFAATGRPPFRTGPMEAVFDRVRRGAADLDGVPAGLARLLAATLRPDPADRPGPEQLADGIASLTGRRPRVTAAGVTATPSSAPVRRVVPPAPPATASTGPAGATAVVPSARPVPSAQGAYATGPAGPVEGTGTGAGATTVAPLPAASPPTRVVERPVEPAPARRPASAPRPDRSSDDGSATGPWAARAPVVTPTTGYGGRSPQPHARYGRLPRQPGRPGRPWLTATAGLVLVAVAAVSAVGAAALALGWATLARSAQWTGVAAARRRSRDGRVGVAGGAGLTLSYPFRLLGALASTVGYLALGLVAVSPLLLLAAAFLARDVPWSNLDAVVATLTVAPVRTGSALVVALLLWLGPGSRAVREGSRALTEPAVRHRNGRLVLAGLSGLVVVAAVLVVASGL